mgnify:CR=1 FL=1
MKRRFQNIQDLPAEFYITEPQHGLFSVRGTIKDGSTVWVQLDRVIKTATATKREPCGYFSHEGPSDCMELYDLLVSVRAVTPEGEQQRRIFDDWLRQAKMGRAA